jgi:hypothetical protein
MRFRRSSTSVVVAFAGVLALLTGAPGQTGKQPQPKKPLNEIIQEFPTNDVMETAWKIHWATTSGYGLYIKDAWFKKSPSEDWIQILGDARCSEIFVPYHAGSPRFWDISYNFPLCTVTKDDAGPHGKLLGGGPKGERPTVVQEVRDRGVIWMDYNGVRRGQQLVLWGTLQAANYRYIIEFSFRDDGSIGFRMGSTGHNYGGSEWVGHMHNGLWRIDVNIDGPDNNTVQVVEHAEPLPKDKLKAKTIVRPFNDGKEGFEDWHAEKFTMLRIKNEKRKNKRGEPIAYDLMPLRLGNARHHGGEREVCTHHDFWVSRARLKQLVYTDVPKYVAKGESIKNTDVVIWHSAPSHHEPRSEDGEIIDGRLVGCTHVMWAGFELRPRNFFDRTPLYPYKK